MLRVWINKDQAMLEVEKFQRSYFYYYEKLSRGKLNTGFKQTMIKPNFCGKAQGIELHGLNEKALNEFANESTEGVEIWNRIDGEVADAKPYFKGTKFAGKSENSFAYVAKLLKHGLPENVAVKTNVKFRWTCGDLIHYIEQIKKAMPLTVNTL